MVRESKLDVEMESRRLSLTMAFCVLTNGSCFWNNKIRGLKNTQITGPSTAHPILNPLLPLNKIKGLILGSGDGSVGNELATQA